jgi:methyl-accepting chemotaxis protein
MIEMTNLRIRGALLLAIFGWICTISLMGAALIFDLRNELVPVVLSAVFSIIPTLFALRNRYDLTAGAVYGIMAAMQPALLVYMLEGHPWQMEGHLYFFVGLAALTLLCDWRPLAVAVGLIAGHLLLLSFFAPQWVFIGSGDFARVLVHGLAVAWVLGVLGPVMVNMGKLFIEQAEARAASDRARAASEASAFSAQAALEQVKAAKEEVEFEREKRIQAERRGMADARRGELMALAAAFESSIAKIVQSVGSAAQQLEHAAGSMQGFAHDAGEQSSSAAREAESASASALKVSSAVSELSKSILGIAANAEQQAELGVAASGASKTGEEVIRALAEQTANIESFVGLIQNVASQTNMLALNATIESARAGEAGRGFGVVAAEVKALANKAHDASGQINQLVCGISYGAAEADQAIGLVSRSMAELSEAAAKMRNAIEDQSNVASLIEQSAVDSAAGANQIAHRIGEVAKAAGEALQFSDEVQASATGLTKAAQTLKDATDEFLSQLRAA